MDEISNMHELKIDRAVLSGKTALLYDNAVVGQVVAIIVAGLLVWVLFASAPSYFVLAWWVAVAGVAAGRLATVVAYRRAKPAEADVGRWKTRFVVGAGIAGVVWGIGSLGFIAGAGIREQLIVAFVAAGMIAGAVPLLSPVFGAFAAFAVPVGLTVGAAVIWQATGMLESTFGIMIALFLFAIFRSAHAMHRTLDGSLRLAYEKTQLAAELEDARRTAEDSSRAKSMFLSNISHEIRTPLNGVLGMNELLMHTALDKEQREFAGAIKSSGEALLAIMNDILDLSRIEAGRLQVQAADFCLPDLVDQVAAAARAGAQTKGLAFDTRIEASLPTFLIGDSTRLRQVLETLIGNAIKFTAAGEVELEVTRIGRPDGKCCLRFAVRDTGIGIPPERIGGLFSPFTQVDGSATRSFGGTGLGLAIARRLVELMGGEIGVYSEMGKGSTFWFKIEFGVPAAMDSPSAADGRAAPLVPASLAGLQIGAPPAA